MSVIIWEEIVFAEEPGELENFEEKTNSEKHEERNEAASRFSSNAFYSETQSDCRFLFEFASIVRTIFYNFVIFR